MRVTLSTSEDVETVLLTAHRLRDGDNKIRIYPDIPWNERREQHKLTPPEAKSSRNRLTVYVHGVPETTDTDEKEQNSHDIAEWRYVLDLLGLHNMVCTSVARTPTSPNYKGTGPKLLRVTMLSEAMATAVLTAWKENRKLLPTELLIRPSKNNSLTDRQDDDSLANNPQSAVGDVSEIQAGAIVNISSSPDATSPSNNPASPPSPKNSVPPVR